MLNVQVGQFLQRPDFFWRELGNSLVDRNRFGKETVADEELRETFEIVDGLNGFALADVQLADGHQGDLVAGLILQDLLIFGDGLRHLPLVQQFLCGFDVLTFVIGHAL